MDEDKFALVEKIIKDVHNVLSKASDVFAFDIIPVDSNHQNKSPVLYLENCLGLESWCVKHVYMYCYTELIDKCCSKQKRQTKKINTVNSDCLIRLLNVILLLNPEISTFWNKRREIVEQLMLDKSYEFHYTRLILSRKPKCNEVFAHRRWLLGIILQGETGSSIDTIVNEELNVCEVASGRCPNNYHSYCHRMWLVNKLKTSHKYDNIEQLYVNEFNFSEKLISKHVSDHSCFHYRQFCIKNILNISLNAWKILEGSMNINLRKVLVRLLADNFPNVTTVQTSEEDLISYSEENLINLLLDHPRKVCKCRMDYVLLANNIQILFYELSLNNELICFYKYHETLWYHRRFIVHEILELMYKHFGLIRHKGALIKKICETCNNNVVRHKQAKIVRYDCNQIYSSVLFNILLLHEKKFISLRRGDNDNYADRHEKYLKFVEGLNSVL